MTDYGRHLGILLGYALRIQCRRCKTEFTYTGMLNNGLDLAITHIDGGEFSPHEVALLCQCPACMQDITLELTDT